MSLQWVADRWSVSKETVRRKLRKAGVRAFCLGGSRNDSVRYDVEDVLTYEAQNQETPAPCPGGRLPRGGVLAPPRGSLHPFRNGGPR